MAQTRSQNKTAAKQSDNFSQAKKEPGVFDKELPSVNETVFARCHRDFALIG